MSKLNPISILVILTGFLFGPAMAAEPGKPAPEISLPGQAGQVVHLSDYKDKVVYLDFWASWCGPCRESFPWMNAMQEKYKQKGMEVVAINLDANHDDAKKFLDKHAASFTVLFDPKGVTPDQYKVMGMPTSFIIGKSGKILVQHMGFNKADRAELEQEMQHALEAQK